MANGSHPTTKKTKPSTAKDKPAKEAGAKKAGKG